MELFKILLAESLKKRARKNMPQIDDFQKFMQDLTIGGYKIISKSVDPNSLNPTQHEFNDEKVQAILKNKSYNSNAIIISNDENILDGHHRWKACSLSDDDQDVICIDMTFNEIYDFVKGKDYVSYKEIHESNFNSNTSMGNFSSSKTYSYDETKAENDFAQYHLERKKEKEKLNEDGDGGSGASSGAGEGATTASNGESGTSIAQNDKSHPESFASGSDPDKKKNLPNSTMNVDSPDNILFKNMLRRKKTD